MASRYDAAVKYIHTLVVDIDTLKIVFFNERRMSLSEGRSGMAFRGRLLRVSKGRHHHCDASITVRLLESGTIRTGE